MCFADKYKGEPKMMKRAILTFIFLWAVGMLSAAEANLYLNPEFKHTTDKKGNLKIANNWLNGKVTMSGDYEGSPAVRVEPVKVKWGGYHGAVINSVQIKEDLKPGKYTFTVWCKPEGKPDSVYLVRHHQPEGQKKRVQTAKSYRGADLPPAGKWTELVMEFEIKPGETRNSVGFATHSTNATGPQAVLFAKPCLVPAEEE